MRFHTADLFDAHEDLLQVASPIFRDYGGIACFAGPVSAIKAFEDNSRVREAVAEPGAGRVLVVDGGGSLRRALLGDLLAQKAQDNGWAGIVIHGCIRDSGVIATLRLGVKALATTPAKTEKRGEGQRDVVVRFADVTFRPGQYLYADEDGLVLSETALL